MCNTFIPATQLTTMNAAPSQCKQPPQGSVPNLAKSSDIVRTARQAVEAIERNCHLWVEMAAAAPPPLLLRRRCGCAESAAVALGDGG